MLLNFKWQSQQHLEAERFNMSEYSAKVSDTKKCEELRRKEVYDALHQTDPLRFPLEDYPIFYSWPGT